MRKIYTLNITPGEKEHFDRIEKLRVKYVRNRKIRIILLTALLIPVTMRLLYLTAKFFGE